MTFFPFGTLMRLLRQVRSGSLIAINALLAFVVGLGLVIGSAITGSGTGVWVGAVMLAAGTVASWSA
jgi:hypothetical protein